MSQSNFTREYVVQQDDQLMAIAYHQDVDYFELLALNPQYHLNPDLIRPGEIVILPVIPEETEDEETESSIPNVRKMPVSQEGCIEGEPACTVKPIHDVLFFTQENDKDTYYTLGELACEELETEISYVEELMQDYREIVESVPDEATAVKQDLIEHVKKKEMWVKKADQAGLIKANSKPKTKEDNLPSQDFIKASIKELGRQRELIFEYHPFFSQVSEDVLKRKKLGQIDAELKQLNIQLQKEPTYNKSDYKPVDQSKMGQIKQREVAHHGLIEILSISRNQLVYIRQEFFELHRETYFDQRNMGEELREALATRDTTAIFNALKNEITQGISEEKQQSAVGKIELKLKEWKLADSSFFEKWSASKSLKNAEGETKFAISSEAQLLRFSAQAALKSDVDLSKGKIDLNIGVQADLALAEGKIEAKAYLPYKKGYPIGISYFDANLKVAKVPLGCFRLNAGVSLRCFVGASASASAGASILLSPSIALEVDEDVGSVGLKGEAFAGAQAGGELTGALEWQSPQNLGKPDFDQLLKFATGGAVSFGLGAGIDFTIQFDGTTFYFVCSARLVFGPGASGSFGTEVDVEKLWELAKIIFCALEVANNRKLNNVDSNAFSYFYRAAYLGFSLPSFVLQSVVIEGGSSISSKWRERVGSLKNKEYKIAEAYQVSKSILTEQTISGIPMSRLPAETIAMMLDILVTTFIFSFDLDDYEQEEQQQKAIMLLLTLGVKTWRKFEEVLIRMNSEAKKGGDKELFDNMARINAILDWEEQKDFNIWVHNLADGIPSQSKPVQKAFNIKPLNNKQKKQKRQLIKEQVIKLKSYKQTDELYV